MRCVLFLLLSLLCLVACDGATSGATQGVDATCAHWSSAGAPGNMTAKGIGSGFTDNNFFDGQYRVSWDVPRDCTLSGTLLYVDGVDIFPPAAFGDGRPGAGSSTFHLDLERYYVKVTADCPWQITIAHAP